MGAVAEFDFQTLEPLAPPKPPVSQAEQVMDILAEARAEAEQIRQAALDEGYAAGRSEALEALQPALAMLATAASEVRSQQDAAAVELERRAVELGLALAQKVLAGALSVEPERVVDSVQGALRGIVERERIIVMVNPEDLEIVQGAIEELRTSLGGIEHCVVEAERRVGRGGCIVRTPVGDVDARIETKLERAGEVVAAALGRS
jgi:flagellar biosynthesis/type III secretory pathway protein FliH